MQIVVKKIIQKEKKKKESIYPTSAFHAAHLYGGLNRDASCHPLWQGEIAHQVH